MLQSIRSNRRASLLTVLFVGSTLFVTAGCSSIATVSQSLVTVGDTQVNPKDGTSVERVLDQLAARYAQQPVAVHKDYATNTIVAETPGKTLDREATRKRLLEAQPGSQVEPVLKSIAPEVTLRDLVSDAPAGYQVIGQFSTRLPSASGYLANIDLSSQFLTDSVVLPGETLSFNEVTGFPTAERGYKPGPGIENGKVVDMYGGGICQVSTTLYNAVAEAGLEVVERHPHSLPVSYVPVGKDAMVYIEEDKDFIFKNNRPTPIIVKSKLQNGMITVTLYEK